MIEIPVNNDYAHQQFFMKLNNERFLLRFHYSTRDNGWYFDILKDTETPVATGARILPAWSPYRIRYELSGMPKGKFYVHDTSGVNDPPGRDDFGVGKKVKLYFEPDATS